MFISEELKTNKFCWRSEDSQTTEADHEATVIQQGLTLLQNKTLCKLLGDQLIKTKRWVFQQKMPHE